MCGVNINYILYPDKETTDCRRVDCPYTNLVVSRFTRIAMLPTLHDTSSLLYLLRRHDTQPLVAVYDNGKPNRAAASESLQSTLNADVACGHSTMTTI